MVNYGLSLRQARRTGWEGAYLDYDSLKSTLEELEDMLMARHSQRLIDHLSFRPEHDNHRVPNQAVQRLRSKFLSQLRVETEKMSLFTLKKQGELAETVGALRFEETNNSDMQFLFQKHMKLLASYPVSENKLDMYAFLGVELLHLLRYLIVNATGVRKILKKFNKIIATLDDPQDYVVIRGGQGDMHLQQMANSQSIMAIQSSLHSALVETYNRNNAPNENPPPDRDKALSLCRFQCVMDCSLNLIKNTEIVQQPFLDFLSRKAMIYTGGSLGGIEGSAQRALEWVLKLHPDDMLSMSETQLEGMWNKWTPIHTRRKTLDILPELGGGDEQSIYNVHPLFSASTREEKEREWQWGGVNAVSMILNLLSIFLYTVNYYIVTPTANHYAIKLGTDGAFGATLIGASSFAALFAAFFYSLWYTKSSFKSALICSTICPLIGNLIYALAISYNSIGMAIGGRILCGFGSAEVVNRQMISACVSFKSMTKASALFVAAGAIGMSVGPFLAAILDMVSGRDSKIDLQLPFTPVGGIVYDNVTSPGFFMAGLWLLQLIALILFFQEPERINGSGVSEEISDTDEDYSPSESSIDQEEGVLIDPSGSKTYGAVPSHDGSATLAAASKSPGLWQEVVSTGRLVFSNPGLPITLLLFAYIEMADEIIISSCSMVVRRYFGWHGAAAGFFIASLGALVLPAHFVVEKAAHYYSERQIMMYSVCFIIVSLFGILNYQGMFYDVVGFSKEEVLQVEDVKHLEIAGQTVKSLINHGKEFPYGWGLGHVIYTVFLSASFMGTIILEGVDTSIMAKVTPAKLNDQFINSGLLATLIGTLGRVFADGMITISALLDIHVFVDFLNATFIPLLLLAFGVLYLVQRWYGFLV